LQFSLKKKKDSSANSDNKYSISCQSKNALTLSPSTGLISVHAL